MKGTLKREFNRHWPADRDGKGNSEKSRKPPLVHHVWESKSGLTVNKAQPQGLPSRNWKLETEDRGPKIIEKTQLLIKLLPNIQRKKKHSSLSLPPSFQSLSWLEIMELLVS